MFPKSNQCHADTAAESYMWSQIEPSAAIFSACIVTYRPLFRHVRLVSIFRKKATTVEPSDVSRRWPTSVRSEKGSEDGLLDKRERLSFGSPYTHKVGR